MTDYSAPSSGPGSGPPSPGPPLLVTADDHLVIDVTRLAAAAGVTPVVVRELGTSGHRWTSASVVLVGSDLAPSAASWDLPRRERVHVVAAAPLPDTVYRDALACGAESVLALPDAAGSLVELLTDAGDGAVSAATTVGVVGGAGGVGATVFASALAGSCSERARTVLVDADLLGAGVDQVLGLPGDGVRWDALLTATGRLGARALRDALPSRDGLAVLAWPVEPDPVVDPQAVREVLSAARRGFDAVVVDLPRYPHLLAEELLPRCDVVLLVTTLTVPAVAASARVARRLPPASTRLVLRGSSGGVDAAEAGRFLGLPVAAVMSGQRGLDEALSLGVGPVRGRRGPLGVAARTVADAVLGHPGPGRAR